MEHSPFNNAAAGEHSVKDAETSKDKTDKTIGKKLFAKTVEKSGVPEASKPTPRFRLFERPSATAETSATDKLPKSPPEATQSRESAPNSGPELQPEERLEAAKRIVEAQKAEATEPPADAAEQAAEAAVNAFRDKITEEDLQPEEAYTAVAGETADTESISDEESEDEPAQDQENEPAAASAEDADDADAETDDEPADPSSTTAPASAQPPAGGHGGNAGGSGGHGGSGGGNGGNQPPIPPYVAPGFGAGGMPPAGPAYSPNYATPNAMPSSTTRTEYVPYRDRSDLLIGGIVGYFMGRRRGRIKTERKLLPVQHKLEREVSALQATIATSEFKLREQARRQVREQAVTAQPVIEKTQAHAPAAETVILDRRERPTASAPEARSLHTPAPAERTIGKVLVAAEALAPVLAERPMHEAAAERLYDTRSVEQQVETLSRNELLTMSEKIIVEGSTLRQVYETHLITERGLRRLTAEYLRGGDVIKAFKRELIERQIDFERDPKLRDKIRQGMRSQGGASPALGKLLAQAGVTTDTDTSAASLAEARAETLQAAKRQSRRQSQRKLVDVSLATTIAVLVAVVIVLLIHRM